MAKRGRPKRVQPSRSTSTQDSKRKETNVERSSGLPHKGIVNESALIDAQSRGSTLGIGVQAQAHGKSGSVPVVNLELTLATGVAEGWQDVACRKIGKQPCEASSSCTADLPKLGDTREDIGIILPDGTVEMLGDKHASVGIPIFEGMDLRDTRVPPDKGDHDLRSLECKEPK
ncbi:hypothetical protein Dimus_003604 [Dionaea muscipula]